MLFSFFSFVLCCLSLFVSLVYRLIDADDEMFFRWLNVTVVLIILIDFILVCHLWTDGSWYSILSLLIFLLGGYGLGKIWAYEPARPRLPICISIFPRKKKVHRHFFFLRQKTASAFRLVHKMERPTPPKSPHWTDLESIITSYTQRNHSRRTLAIQGLKKERV